MSSDKISKQPLEKIEWVHRDSISPNDYNPNFMGANELELLATSIVEDGWLFPLLITPDKTIIDGYHRYKASGTYPRVYALTDGYLPVITVDQSKADELMLRTIRMNRAKGVHGVTQMSAIIKHMISEGKSMQEMTTRLKMEE